MMTSIVKRASTFSTKLSSTILERQQLLLPRTIIKRKSHFFSTFQATTTTSEIVETENEWRKHPELKKKLEIPTWIVPSNVCQKIVKSSILKNYLFNIEHVHPRIRIVQSHSKTHQLILLSDDEKNKKELTSEALELLQSLDVQTQNTPKFEIELNYTNWTVAYILNQVLPKEVHPPPTAYEQIGHVAHMNLRKMHLPYRNLIGDVILNSIHNIETVVNKVGEVSGDHRTYEMELLAGREDTNVDLQESGVKLRFDVKDVYWCSRLSGERNYMMKHVLKQNQTIADPFCGVGAQLLMAAQKLNCRIIANDWNPHAVAAIKANAKLNNVESNFQKVTCQDAYDFLTDVGLAATLPDHILMNFPLEAPKFLSALRWWSELSLTKKVAGNKSNYPMFHIYTFARDNDDDDDDDSTGGRSRSIEDVAIDLIAENLLPVGGAAELEINRKEELDQLGCEVQARTIRDVAPGKVVVCVSFYVTSRLLKNIQGDFM